MSELYVDSKIKATDKAKAAKVLAKYADYTTRINRVERLAKLLKLRRESVTIRDARALRKGTMALKYAGTVLYWTSELKRNSIESIMRFQKGAHEKFIDLMYPVFKHRCKDCDRPLYINSRAELASHYPAKQCKICRDAEYEKSNAEYRKRVEEFEKEKQLLKTMPYREYLQTAHWQNLRVSMLKRAGYKCSVCGESKPLHVHHNTYERRGEEKLSDLVVLCHECHELYHEVN